MKFALVAMCVASALAAQEREARGRRLLEQALQALGGERFRAMRDRVESGRAYSFYREELSGLARTTIYTRYLSADVAPGELRVEERQSFGNNEDRGAVLFTRSQAYQITFRGARPLPAETLQRYRETTLCNVFYILRQRLDEPGLMAEWRGSDLWEGQRVELLEITDSDNRSVTVYLNASTLLPVRQVFHRRDPKTRLRVEEVTLYSKYRDAGGVLWPYVIERERDGEKIFQMYSERVEINRGLSDDLFRLPPGIKMLKPLP
ncbi:MAG: hypothetical protein RMI94_08050 [Bryobacterales bacterium]|nr:hypothetical protein [Bryobacteraceae bacterium]MDW8130488.1 hypothetical protein [Bryobacterales bacterium]